MRTCLKKRNFLTIITSFSNFMLWYWHNTVSRIYIYIYICKSIFSNLTAFYCQCLQSLRRLGCPSSRHFILHKQQFASFPLICRWVIVPSHPAVIVGPPGAPWPWYGPFNFQVSCLKFKLKITIISTASSPRMMGLYDSVNLTTELNYKLIYTWQITVRDTKYNIYIFTITTKKFIWIPLGL